MQVQRLTTKIWKLIIQMYGLCVFTLGFTPWIIGCILIAHCKYCLTATVISKPQRIYNCVAYDIRAILIHLCWNNFLPIRMSQNLTSWYDMYRQYSPRIYVMLLFIHERGLYYRCDVRVRLICKPQNTSVRAHPFVGYSLHWVFDIVDKTR